MSMHVLNNLHAYVHTYIHILYVAMLFYFRREVLLNLFTYSTDKFFVMNSHICIAEVTNIYNSKNNILLNAQNVRLKSNINNKYIEQNTKYVERWDGSREYPATKCVLKIYFEHVDNKYLFKRDYMYM